MIQNEAAFFDALNLDYPGLADVKAAVALHDWDAAKQAWAKHLQTRTQPKWTWSHEDKDRIIALLKEHGDDLSKHIKPADDVLARRFNPQGEPYQLQKHIDWQLKRSEETHVLSRFEWWRDLGMAYWKSGDAKYADDFVLTLKDWVADNPVPPDLSRATKSNQPWRTLEAGIRVINWLDAMQLFMDAPAFDAQAKYLMSKSLVEHASYLYAWTPALRNGNWQVTEAGGVAIMGMMLPEAKDSAAWRERGLTRLGEHLEKDVLPDGGHSELTPSYHAWVMQQLTRVARLCQLNGFTLPGPNGRLEKMYDWLMSLSQPDRRVPAIGDTHDSRDIQDDMATGALLFNRADMRDLARPTAPASWAWLFDADAYTRYQKIDARVPDFTSRFLPDSKYAVMRSGWQQDDRHLFFSLAAPDIGHSHQNRLEVTLHAGRDLLIDPGIYSYNMPLSESYFRLAEAHNVVLIDGQASPRSKDPETYPKVLAWESATQADFASGSTAFNGFTHQRSVLFVKPNYWVVVDRITGSGEHEIARLFHFPIGAFHTGGATASTAFETGTNLQILAADGAAPAMEQGWIPVEAAKAERAPVAIFKTKGTLPMTLVTVLTPFTDKHALPTAQASVDPSGAAKIGLSFPDGQHDAITIAPEPTPLSPGDDQALSWATVERQGPQSNESVKVTSHPASTQPN